MRKKRNSEGNIEHIIKRVMEMMTRLEAVIQQENEALRAMDRQKFLDLQLEKVSLRKNYELEAQKLLALRGKIGRLDEDLKKELKTTYARFVEYADENLKILSRRKEGAKRLNNRIMKTARDVLVKQEERYDSSGQIYQGKRNKTLSSGMIDTV